MEPAEAAEQFRETAAENEGFRIRTAIFIAALAVLLAIANLGGDNATKEAMNSNILASDSWAFYQAKNIRQTANQLAADEMESALVGLGEFLSPQAREGIQRNLDRYKSTVARYESEPDKDDPDNPLKGEGKKELTARAQFYEHKRDHALAQDPNFDYSNALFQIAIVLASVAIVRVSRALLAFSGALGAMATVLLLNGFLLLFQLPFL